MKTLISVTRRISLLLLVIFVMQVGGITCANDVYAEGPSTVQGKSFIRAVDVERGTDASPAGDILYECQCPCHLSFSQIEPVRITSFWLTEPHFLNIARPSVRILTREILQPPKILS